jgi:predicted metal-dependent enzyme (double-stranded beta helix superfamily)
MAFDFPPVHVDPFSDQLAERTAELLTPGQQYPPEALEALVCDIARRDDLWRPLVVIDRERRRYQLLYEDRWIDIWVLSWMPGQRTGFHDHDRSGVGLCCAQGALDEGMLVLGGRAAPIRLPAGGSRNGPGGYIHSVAHVAGEPAVSIHAYSPPLMVVGQYSQDATGRLVRTPEHGRKELFDRTIACDSVQLTGAG